MNVTCQDELTQLGLPRASPAGGLQKILAEQRDRPQLAAGQVPWLWFQSATALGGLAGRVFELVCSNPCGQGEGCACPSHLVGPGENSVYLQCRQSGPHKRRGRPRRSHRRTKGAPGGCAILRLCQRSKPITGDFLARSMSFKAKSCRIREKCSLGRDDFGIGVEIGMGKRFIHGQTHRFGKGFAPRAPAAAIKLHAQDTSRHLILDHAATNSSA